jgi:glycerol-3-phosphate cytidylyltransferase
MKKKLYKIGLVWGCFDALHIGHLRALEKEASMCEQLLVSVCNDEYIRKFKNREPIIPLEQREEMLRGLKCVSMVVEPLDENDDKSVNVNKYNPDVLFVGDNWNEDTYTGMGLGVKVEFIPATPSVSTTEIIEKVKEMDYKKDEHI